MTHTLCEYQCTFVISHHILRMTNVADSSCRENQNTHFVQ